jgi:hypothetical protein
MGGNSMKGLMVGIMLSVTFFLALVHAEHRPLPFFGPHLHASLHPLPFLAGLLSFSPVEGGKHSKKKTLEANSGSKGKNKEFKKCSRNCYREFNKSKRREPKVSLYRHGHCIADCVHIYGLILWLYNNLGLVYIDPQPFPLLSLSLSHEDIVVSIIYKIKCYKIISSGIINTSSHILFKLDEERRMKKFSAILSILKRQKFREFFWPVPISVPIDGYTWLFI